jgi:hypothetical protein
VRSMDRICQSELTMAADRTDSELEAERAYWQARLANLEMLLCELLIKNERLRREREMYTLTQSDPGTVLTIS